MDFNNHDENSGFDNAGNGTSNDGNNDLNNRPSNTYDTGNNNYNNTPNNNGSYNNDFNNSNYNDNYNNNYSNNGFNDNNMYNNNNNGTNGYAIASLVLGILSIPLGCCYGFGIILSILAIIFGIVSKKSSGGRFSGIAIGGIICAILGIITSVFMIISLIVIIRSSDFRSLTDIINSTENSGNSYYY